MGSNKPKGLKYIQELASLGDLVCTSISYNGSNCDYSFKCNHGHEFDRSYRNITTNQLCPECKKTQLVIYNKKDLEYWQNLGKKSQFNICRQSIQEC